MNALRRVLVPRLQPAFLSAAADSWGQQLSGISALLPPSSSWQPSQPSPPSTHWTPHLQHVLPAGNGLRGYAKGRGKNQKAAAAAVEEDESAADQEFTLDEFDRLMDQAVEYLRHELAGVRTGRANPGLLENLSVSVSGSTLPLKACGTVTVRSPQLLAVAVFNPENVSDVVKAIQNSPLQLVPSSEGSEVLVKLPRMTKETVDRMVKLVHLESENASQSVRRARQKAMDAVKKAFKDASADDRKRTEKQVQKLHDSYIAAIENLKKQKDAELRQHKD